MRGSKAPDDPYRGSLCRMCAETVPVLLPTSVIDARRRVGGAADRAALTGRCTAEYASSTPPPATRTWLSPSFDSLARRAGPARCARPDGRARAGLPGGRLGRRASRPRRRRDPWAEIRLCGIGLRAADSLIADDPDAARFLRSAR